MRYHCYFLAHINQYDDKQILFDLFHIVKQPMQLQKSDPIRSSIQLPRHYFDYLVQSGVLEVEDSDGYMPQQVAIVAIGMNIKSLGSMVRFDMCFSPQTYNLWQTTDASIDEIELPADFFEEYVYRLGALSRFRYLGRVEDPLVATRLGENDMIEFKRDFLLSKAGIIKSVVAFANSNNGNLFLGIDDDGQVLGVDHEVAQYGGEDKYILAITQYIQDKISPFLAPFPKITLKQVEGKYVVVIFVEVGTDMICGLDKNGDKFVAIRTNNRSIIIRDPHQIGEIYARRKLGSEVSRRLGLL